jgi:hypothetical protein
MQASGSDDMHVPSQQDTWHCANTNMNIRDCVIPISSLLFLRIPCSFKDPLSNARATNL